jgi:hypothetical protein
MAFVPIAVTNAANTFTAPQRGPFLDKGGAVHNIRAYGAACDGVTDDTDAIQAAIDAAALSGPGSKVTSGPGTSIVSARGAILGGGIFTCLIHRAGVDLDFPEDFTIKLANGQNSTCVIVDSRTAANGGPTPTLAITSLTLDGNEQNQTVTGVLCPTLYYTKSAGRGDYATTGMRIGRLVVRNGLHWAVYIALSRYAEIGSVRVYGCRGGGNHIDLDDSTVGELFSENCASSALATGSGTVLTIQNCKISTIGSVNNKWAIKIQNDTQDSHIGHIFVRGGALSDGERSVKFQGSNGTTQKVRRVSVGSIEVHNVDGQGVYFHNAEDVTINKVLTNSIGANGALSLSDRSDLLFVGNVQRVHIGDWTSLNASAFAMWVAATTGTNDVTGIAIDRATVVRPVVGVANLLLAGTIAFGDLSIEFDGVTPSNGNLIDHSGAKRLTIRRITTDTAIPSGRTPVSVGDATLQLDVSAAQFGTGPVRGFVTLGYNVTETVVASASVARWSGATYLQPIIRLQPANASAAALGQMRASPYNYSGGGGFAIKHATAGAADVVFWELVGYCMGETYPT